MTTEFPVSKGLTVTPTYTYGIFGVKVGETANVEGVAMAGLTRMGRVGLEPTTYGLKVENNTTQIPNKPNGFRGFWNGLPNNHHRVVGQTHAKTLPPYHYLYLYPLSVALAAIAPGSRLFVEGA